MMIDKHNTISFAMAMAVKIVYGLAIFMVGAVIVIVCEWFMPTFSIYMPDSVVYIAGIFMVYSALDFFLLSKTKPTPALILTVVLLSPVIIVYAVLKHLDPVVFVESAPANVKRYAFYKPSFRW